MGDTVSSNAKDDQALVFPDTNGKFRPGDVLSGKYEVVSVLGAGGMGSVYRVKQLFLGQDCALKTLDRAHASSWRRFQIEAKTSFSLDHPNLVRVHDLGSLDNGQPFLVMDFIDGITLAEHLKQTGPLSIEEMRPLLRQTCEGMSYAHERGVVHRDIKPSNIMLMPGWNRDTKGCVKVVDFGIAKLTATAGGEVQALTRTGEIFGSPLYMSPEQCSGDPVDHRSDIYSLGCVLFEALTGAPPHLGENALRTMMLHQSERASSLKEASLGKDFPDKLEQIVSKMLRKSPDDRYQSLSEVAEDVSAIATGMREKDDLSGARIPAKIHSAKTNNSVGAISTIVILLAVAAAAYFFKQDLFKQNFLKPAPLPQSKTTAASSGSREQPGLLDAMPALDNYKDANAADEQKELLNAPGVESTIVRQNGHPRRKFTFPDRPIGEIADYQTTNFQNNGKAAKGIVYCDPGTPLSLVIEGQAAKRILKYPSFFAKIGPSEFHGLCLSLSSPAQSQSLDATSVAVADVLRNACRWSHLESLDLKGLPLNEQSIDAINHAENLRYIQFEECSGDLSKLGSNALSQSLIQIYLVRLPASSNADAALNNLSHATHLERIGLNYSHASDAGLRSLASCGSLQYLCIHADSFDDKTIDAITRLRSLKDLMLMDAPLTKSQFDKLYSAQWIARIDLTRPKDPQIEAELARDSKHRIRFPSE